MGKHNKKGTPRTGNGYTGGAKPGKAQMSVKSGDGATIWKATAALFGVMNKKKK